MANYFFGPCSPEWFNSLFFGNRATTLSEQENTNLRSVFMNEFESDPAADEGNRLMCALITNNTHCRVNDLTMVNTSNHVMKIRNLQIKTDALVFVDGPPSHVSDPDSLASYADIFVEWKTGHTADGWVDRRGYIVPNPTTIGQEALGQSIDYATALFNAPRTHCFSITFFGDQARLVRWDRTAVVVSASFSYVEAPGHLIAFLRGLAAASRYVRGWDTTVSRLAVPAAIAIREKVRAASNDATVRDSFKGPLHEFSMPSIARPNEKDTYIAPVYAPYVCEPLIGRGTSASLVWNETTSALCFYKRTWRVNEPELDREGDVALRIHAPHSHTPTVLAHEDIDAPYHRMGIVTKLQASSNLSWIDATLFHHLRQHCHYHIVVKEVCRSLDEFRTSKEAVIAIRDAVEALNHALAHGVMHRDVSIGNILITKDGRGILNDWEFSTVVRVVNGGYEPADARLAHRTGTWEFISGYRLQIQPGDVTLIDVDPHLPDDDMESILWVVVWVPMKHMAINIPNRTSWLNRLFRSYTLDDNGRAVGGDTKTAFLSSNGKLGGIELKVEGNLPYTTLIKRLAALFSPRYLDADEYRRSRVTGSQVLAIFEECLRMDGWPTEDDGPKRPPPPLPDFQPSKPYRRTPANGPSLKPTDDPVEW